MGEKALCEIYRVQHNIKIMLTTEIFTELISNLLFGSKFTLNHSIDTEDPLWITKETYLSYFDISVCFTCQFLRHQYPGKVLIFHHEN